MWGLYLYRAAEPSIPERFNILRNNWRMKSAFALLASLVLAGCAAASGHPGTDSAPPVAHEQAALGQPIRVGTLIASPLEVIEDSRCPMNARCVWAGRVVLSTRLEGAGWQETAQLTLGDAYSTHGTSISLTSVSPEPMAGAEIESSDYRFGFEGGN